MSEAPQGGQDSRSGEDPQAGAPALAHECDSEALLGAPSSHARPQAAAGGRVQEGPRRDGGPQGPGGDSYAWYRRGLDLLSRGSPAAAAELLERAAEAEPGARSIREALARAQFDAGRYAQAADNFRQNVEAIPSDDYAHFGLGLALARGGNPAAAAEHLALAAAMRPELSHYAEALRGVRATLAARAAAGPPPPAARDGEPR
jgi:tetratricopeptide (TPR) repeat protein